MLIDTKGKIVYKGHPASRPNLEEDFDKLLKGEDLGIDNPAAKKEEEGAAEGGATNEKDPAACMAYIDQFKAEIAPGLQKNENVSTSAKAMPRAFCVMVYEETLNVVSGKSNIDWKNYRVLVGPKDKIDTCKKEIESALDEKAGFEIVLREQAI